MPRKSINTIIKQYLVQHNIQQQALAERMDISQPTFSRMLRRPAMLTTDLMRICDILEHNFFLDLAAEFGPVSDPSAVNVTMAAVMAEVVKQNTLLMEQNREARQGRLKGNPPAVPTP